MGDHNSRSCPMCRGTGVLGPRKTENIRLDDPAFDSRVEALKKAGFIQVAYGAKHLVMKLYPEPKRQAVLAEQAAAQVAFDERLKTHPYLAESFSRRPR